MWVLPTRLYHVVGRKVPWMNAEARIPSVVDSKLDGVSRNSGLLFFSYFLLGSWASHLPSPSLSFPI